MAPSRGAALLGTLRPHTLTAGPPGASCWTVGPWLPFVTGSRGGLSGLGGAAFGHAQAWAVAFPALASGATSRTAVWPPLPSHSPLLTLCAQVQPPQDPQPVSQCGCSEPPHRAGLLSSWPPPCTRSGSDTSLPDLGRGGFTEAHTQEVLRPRLSRRGRGLCPLRAGSWLGLLFKKSIVGSALAPGVRVVTSRPKVTLEGDPEPAFTSPGVGEGRARGQSHHEDIEQGIGVGCKHWGWPRTHRPQRSDRCSVKSIMGLRQRSFE